MIGRLPVVLALCLSVTACGAKRSALQLQNSDPPAAADEAALKDLSATSETTNETTNETSSAAIVPVGATTEVTTPAPAVTDVPRAAATRAFDADAEFRIGTEDLLDVQVWRNCPDLCRTVPVRPDGKVSLPLVNDIQAAGFTTSELRQQITQKLAEFIPSPEVSVIVREVHSVKVSVVGAVRMPGNYEVKSAATVLDMIARAQGLTEFANRDRIVVHRQNAAGTTQISFNYSRVADGKAENFFVQPGDIIVVP